MLCLSANLMTTSFYWWPRYVSVQRHTVHVIFLGLIRNLNGMVFIKSITCVRVQQP